MPNARSKSVAPWACCRKAAVVGEVDVDVRGMVVLFQLPCFDVLSARSKRELPCAGYWKVDVVGRMDVVGRWMLLEDWMLM